MRPAACKGLPLSQAPFTNGLIWMIDISIGLGTGKILAVLACRCPSPSARVQVPPLWSMSTASGSRWPSPGRAKPLPTLLKRLIAQMGRPAAYLKDGGSELQKAVDLLDEQGLGSPCIDDISHAAAGMLKRIYQDHPAFERFSVGLWAGLGQAQAHASGVFGAAHRAHQSPLYECAPLVHLGRSGAQALATRRGQERLDLSQVAGLPRCTCPPAKPSSSGFEPMPAALLACQKILKTKGLSHDTLAQCEPLIDTMPSSALRQEFRAYLDFELETATTLGLDHIGLPISSDAIESLFGVAKHHGVGETQDAARIALRLPALCGVPTREEAEQVLDVSVARQQEVTGQVISLTKQRREVLGHPERLESLGLESRHPSCGAHTESQKPVKLSRNHQYIKGL